jgi:methylated-DNA-protein-cysteine methyltransferase related protein
VRPRRSGSQTSQSEAYDPAAYVEAVLDLVESIPAGWVMSYGAIADHLYTRFGRGSARRVGTIMAWYGGPVPWHRVVTGGGRLPPGHEQEAARRLAAEGVVLRGTRVSMAQYAWSPRP